MWELNSGFVCCVCAHMCLCMFICVFVYVHMCGGVCMCVMETGQKDREGKETFRCTFLYFRGFRP